MDSVTVIKKVLEFDTPDRIGLNLCAPYPNDLGHFGVPLKSRYNEVGKELRQLVKISERMQWYDAFGNIWGKLEQLSKGEVVKGCFQDGWEMFDSYVLPEIDAAGIDITRLEDLKHSKKYIVGHLPGFPFSLMRKMRGIENFLTDILTDPEKVQELGKRITRFLKEMIDVYASLGIHGIMFCEDWGTECSLFISPESWRTIFKPWFREIAATVHQKNMHLIMHSCGNIIDIFPDLIEVGVDALQVQTELMGVERLGEQYRGKVTFFCKMGELHLLKTAEKAIIQQATKRMVGALGSPNGGFIAADYSQWSGQQVPEERLNWVRDVFVAADDMK